MRGESRLMVKGVSSVSSELLRMIKNMTGRLEVARCSAGAWEQAIVQGFAVWRERKRRGAGPLSVDLDARSITLQAS